MQPEDFQSNQIAHLNSLAQRAYRNYLRAPTVETETRLWNTYERLKNQITKLEGESQSDAQQRTY